MLAVKMSLNGNLGLILKLSVLFLLVERFVPTKVIRVRNKDKPWFNDDCRLAFDIKQGAHLQWTRDRSRDNSDEFLHYQRRANAVYPRLCVSLVSEAGMF